MIEFKVVNVVNNGQIMGEQNWDSTFQVVSINSISKVNSGESKYPGWVIKHFVLIYIDAVWKKNKLMYAILRRIENECDL